MPDAGHPDPLSMTAVDAEGVSLRLGPPMMRYSLRARDVGAIEALVGSPVPGQIGRFAGDVACLGPDEWLWRSATATRPLPAGTSVAAVNVSERSVCFILEGSRAVTVLNSGCPLDLERFAVGRATRTMFETVEIILLRTGDDQWQVDVWRSFAPWLWEALSAAMAD